MNKPEYHLAPINADGTLGPVEKADLTDVIAEASGSRRDVFKIGLATSSLLSALGLSGCDESGSGNVPNQSHIAPITFLAFSPDSRLIATCSYDGTVKVWNVSDGSLLHSLKLAHGEAREVSFSGDGTLVGTAGEGVAMFWRTTDGALMGTIERKIQTRSFGGSNVLAFSPTDRMFALGLEPADAQQRAIALFKFEADGAVAGSPFQTIKFDRQYINKMAFTSDGERLVIIGGRDAMEIRSVPEGGKVCELEKFINATVCAGKTLLAGESHDILRKPEDALFDVYDTTTGNRVKSARTSAEVGYVSEIALAPKGDLALIAYKPPTPIASADNDRWRVGRYSLADETFADITEERPAMIYTLAIEPDGGYFVLHASAANHPGISDGGAIIEIRDLPEGKLLARLPDVPMHRTKESLSQTMHLSPDGKVLATCHSYNRMEGYGGTVKLWALPQGSFERYLLDPAVPPPPPENATGGGTYYGNRRCICIPVRSDRDEKSDIRPTDEKKLLERLAQLTVHEWSYRDEGGGVRHVGPMAQDFAAAFEVGGNDREIQPVDAIGVALASIRELHRMVQAQAAEIAELRERLPQDQSVQASAQVPTSGSPLP